MFIPMQTGNKPPFKVTIKPRSQAHADLIRRECREVAEELERLVVDGSYLKATVN
jgi:hypothetical protein